MNNSPLKARDIEALTFIYGGPGTVGAPERNRWSKFFNLTWLKLAWAHLPIVSRRASEPARAKTGSTRAA